jgi:hypothetical protein
MAGDERDKFGIKKFWRPESLSLSGIIKRWICEKPIERIRKYYEMKKYYWKNSINNYGKYERDKIQICGGKRSIYTIDSGGQD